MITSVVPTWKEVDFTNFDSYVYCTCTPKLYNPACRRFSQPERVPASRARESWYSSVLWSMCVIALREVLGAGSRKREALVRRYTWVRLDVRTACLTATCFKVLIISDDTLRTSAFPRSGSTDFRCGQNGMIGVVVIMQPSNSQGEQL
jgi:hypothetical protein